MTAETPCTSSISPSPLSPSRRHHGAEGVGLSFTKFGPLAVTAIGYAIAFYFLALTLKAIPVGVAYAIWSGLGIVLISVMGFVVFRQSLDIPAIVGLGLIIAGVIVINGFSKAVAH